MTYRSHSLPGPGDFCPGCNRLLCSCRPGPDLDVLFEEAYGRGYEACTVDGFDNHPLACWPRDEAEAAMAHDWVRLVSGGSVVGVDGRRFYGCRWFNVPYAWRYRGVYGHDPLRSELCPEGYLTGWDDAGAGLPSAVSDPERHAACAAALDAYEPSPDLYDQVLGPADVEDGLPF